MNNIAKFRTNQGYTQKELANILKINQSAIAKWETGKASPTADKLPLLAKLFKCNIDDLFNLKTVESEKQPSERS